ncbi:cation diffusion facilitator family transporter [Staphylococcus massiliensis]|nr:cation diffusion facilitator family transporter [Staphylococcus massiliensis]
MTMSEHHHVHTNNKKVLALSVILIGGFMIIECIGGFLTGSLALLSDSVHMLSDTVSLLVALLAFIFAEKKANTDKTYGYKRFEILAALFNGVTLIIISVFIIIEAIKRFFYPPEIMSLEMFWISVIGLVINVIVAMLMFKGGDTKHNINMKSAFLHVIGDLLGSIGAIIAALLIFAFNVVIADTIASLIVALLILRSGWSITQTSINILMEGTPKEVDVEAVFETILTYEEIKSVHDCHVWSITSGVNALSCHATVSQDLSTSEGEALLNDIESSLKALHIHHMTIQLETINHQHDDNFLCTHIH